MGADRNIAKSGKNYSVYRMTLKDIACCVGIALLLSMALAWTFYQNPWGLLIYPVIQFFVIRKWRSTKVTAIKHQLSLEFKECMRFITDSLYSGFSVEKAFVHAEVELGNLFGTKGDLYREVQEINRQIKMNVPVEGLLEDLAFRSGIEEIARFGQVFGYAKRNGSDFIRILKDTGDHIAENMELTKELATLIAAKKMEQKVMNVIPMGILVFVNLSSPEFLEMMYQGVLGRTLMSVCLVIYGIAYLVSEKIVDVKV